jgi:hypothetical protein
MQESNTRKKIIIFSVILGTVLFLCLFFYFSGNHKSQHGATTTTATKNVTGSVVFEQPNLYIFDGRQLLNQYPDTIRFHFPYLLVITPGDYQQTSTVYSLTERQKVKVFNKVLLDYSNGNILYSNGKTTFYNKTNLNISCSQGYIKDKVTIFCLTPKADDPLDNKIISINPQTLNTQDYFSSDKLITTFTFIQNTLFVGEEDTTTQKPYLHVGDNEIELPTQADIIYTMNEKPYYATFKVSDSNRDASYYVIERRNNDITTKLIGKEKIVFQ